MHTADITIESWHNEISVPRNHPDPTRVRDHVEKLTSHVQVALEAALDGYLSRRDGEIILMRALEVALDLDTGCDIEQASRNLAQCIARQLVEKIEGAAPDVVRFRSDADYVARFIEDLSKGRAWGQWFYAAFDGLRVLPASWAIRTVLVSDPQVGRRALARISPSQWRGIAAALDAADAIRIVGALADETADPDGIRLSDEAPAIVDEFLHARGLSPASLALALIAAFVRLDIHCTPTLIHAVEVLTTLIVSTQSGDRTTIAALLGSMDTPPQPCEIFPCVPTHLRIAQRGALRELARNVMNGIEPGIDGPPQTTDTHLASQAYETPFAGYIIVLDEIDELLGAHMTGVLLDGAPARGAVALAILACVAGRGRGPLLWQDLAWRQILGVSPSLSWFDFVTALADSGEPTIALPTLTLEKPDIRTAGRHLTFDSLRSCAKQWRRFFVAAAYFICQRLSRRVPGMLGASVPYLRTNLLAAPGRLEFEATGRFRLQICRPPLHVLLALTGMGRGARRWRGHMPTHITIEYV